MAPLSTADRQRVWRGFMRLASSTRDPLPGILKQDLYDAVAATDDWIDTNASSFNSALPTATRTNLTTTQKTLLFCAVALARVSIALLRSVFGEVE